MSTNVAGVNLDNLPVPEVPVPDKYQGWLKYLYPVLALVIAGGAFTLFIVPTLNDALTLKGETDDNATKASNLDQKLATLKGADKNKLNDDLSKLEVALPTDKDAAGFLANVNQNANNTGVSVSSVQLIPMVSTSQTPGAVAAASPTKNVLEFQLAITGDYPKIRGFLTSVETTRRVMAVKAINLSFDKNLTATMTIDTYFQPASSVVPGNSDPLPVRTAAQDRIFSDIVSRTVAAPPIATPNAGGRTDPFSGF